MTGLNTIFSNEYIHRYLKEAIGNERYEHSLRVSKTAVELAKAYNCNEEKAEIAGLLHDCGKLLRTNEILKKANDFGIIQDDIVRGNVGLIHGPLGAILAAEEYNVNDEEILSAIKIHTTGKANMSLLEKIIYLSDYIEPERDFPGIDNIRETAYLDLDKAVLLSMDGTIKYIINKGALLHEETIKARNFMILKIKENRR